MQFRLVVCYEQLTRRSLAEELTAALGGDAALSATTPLRTWEETVIPQDDGEMRFSLPAAPSPAVLLALLAACRELERAGATPR